MPAVAPAARLPATTRQAGTAEGGCGSFLVFFFPEKRPPAMVAIGFGEAGEAAFCGRGALFRGRGESEKGSSSSTDGPPPN